MAYFPSDEDMAYAANDDGSGVMPKAPLLRGADWLAEPLPELEYLIADIGLVAGGGAPHLVAGYGYSGKTVAIQAALLALAAGQPVWGCYKGKPGARVAHIDLEQGERLTRRRYQRLARAMGIDLASLGDTLGVGVMPPGLALTESCRPQWTDIMAARDMISIDSLRAASAGQDENDSAIRGGIDMLGMVSEDTKCRALLLHHARKVGQDDPGGRYAIRGSSGIFDAVDGAYLFSATKGEPVCVEHVKARSHGEPVEDFALVISDVELDGDPKGGLQVRVHGKELVEERRQAAKEAAIRDGRRRDVEKVRKTIREHPGVSTTELRGFVGMNGERLAAALAELGQDLTIQEVSQGRTRVKKHYLKAGAT